MSSLQKLAIVIGAVLLLVSGYFFYQSQAGTTINVTLDSNDSLNQGLVGWWTFDGNDVDWSSTTAEIRDRSGNGNHGNATTTMTASISPTSGVLGQAMSFDGVGDLVSVGARSTLDILGEESVFAWIKLSSTTVESPILVREGSGIYRMRLIYASNGTINGMWADTVYTACGATLSESLNQWRHVGFVRSGATGNWTNTVYIDGEQADQCTGITYNPAGGVSNDVYIGYSVWSNPISYFHGAIDDVRDYNRALSADEVKRLYGLGATTKIGQTLDSNTSLDTGLVGHWTFDGPDVDWSSTTAEIRDRSGNGNHGNAVASVTSTNITSGILGQALFLSSGSQWIEIPEDASLDNLDPVSYSFWFKVDSVFEGGLIARDVGNGFYWSVDNAYGHANRQLNFIKQYDGGQDLQFGSSAYVYNFNEWTHVAVTISGASSSNAHLYVNGVERSISATDGLGSPPSDAGTKTYLGHAGVTPGARELDDVRIYNRALSADEVRRLYQLGATTKVAQTITTNPDLERGLVGHWTFDGKDVDWGSTTAEIRDRSGNNNHGNATGGMTKTSATNGPLGQAISFDGSGSRYVDVGTPPSLTNIVDQGGGGMTIALWVNPTLDANGVLVSKDTWNGPNLMSASNKQLFFFHPFSTSGLDTATDMIMQANTWQHVAVTWDGGTSTANVLFYRNGQEQSKVYNVNGVGTRGSDDGNGYMIGDDGGYGSFNGSVDDVRIYNRILSADEVKRLYDLGR